MSRVLNTAQRLVLFLGIAGLLSTRVYGLPQGTNLTSLVVIPSGYLANSAQRVLVATLQGVVARQSTRQIYIDGGSGYTIWRNHLSSAYGIPQATVASPWVLVSQFKNLVNGYVLYDASANSNSLDAATSLCGPLNGMAADASIESTVRSYGITNRLADVRGVDAGWVWTNYHASLSRKLVIEQKPSFSDNLRDYAVMANAYTFFVGNTPFRSFVMSQMELDSACLGWGDASQGENTFVGDGSAHGVYTVAADWALNLSTLSSVRGAPAYQHTYAIPTVETNVHYVTFIVTDGDNVQWNLGDFAGYFNQPARGRFDMGWALSPSLADLAPSVLRWYFDNASNGPGRDFFIAGPSGAGYFYPSLYPAAALDSQVQNLNDCMDRADLNLGQVIDFNSFNRRDLWNKYLAQPSIDALFYLEYSPYNGGHGAVLFSANGKPVIAPRDLLWSGLEEESDLIANLNSYPRDPSSPEGYTAVMVHVWSKTLANVLEVVTNLPPDVRVVTPGAFVRLLRDNVGRKLRFDFATSLQGWNGGTNGGYYDKAWWTGGTGHPPGALLLDGSDLGHPDSTPNSWFSRQLILPVNATALTFDTEANNDGLLRVRLQQSDGQFVRLQDWQGLPVANTWVSRSVSLTAYAGQTVTIYFEQNDGGQGSGEYRYVDNVAVQTSGTPGYLPDAPKLLSAAAGNAVALLWRDNDTNEGGFNIERSTGNSGVWLQLAYVPSGITNYVDTGVVPGTNYAYRLRSRNAAGFSSYSNVRVAAVPARPTLTGSAGLGQFVVTWPSWATNFNLYSTTGFTPAPVWSRVAAAVTVSGGLCRVTLPLDSAGRLFQLRSPSL
jgi:GxGYxYP putative glycoside hydrolase C-terminal domain/GxGYxYP third domain/GxGYxYP_N 1st domain/GxGYxYP_N second domain